MEPFFADAVRDQWKIGWNNSWFLNRSNTDHSVQFIYMARFWKFRIDCMCAQIILKTWASYQTEKSKQPRYTYNIFFFSSLQRINCHSLSVSFFQHRHRRTVFLFWFWAAVVAVGTFGYLFCVLLRVSGLSCSLVICGVCMLVVVFFLSYFFPFSSAF